ncbi:alpha/beta hydrolase [uncultured Limosilactobacillus sp.]|uniref:alpha/beta hydrolase n=1 Tax=uncultured Limosilactobacillus sp. TaxID=2837629 RepID=UPI0025DF2D5A|nr:alpha/beta hydrolase [uncultured Limosilactobacillus sp.]
MKNWSLMWLVAAMVVVVSSGLALAKQRSTQQWVHSTTPTIFIHGYGSSYHAEESMVKAAKQAGVTKTVARATVAKDGQVTISGDRLAGKRNPIVEVNLVNNKQTDMAEGAKYIRNVILALQKRDQLTKYNFVAHSMGNMDAFSYLNDYGSQSGMPKLQKQVVIAGGGLSGWTRDRSNVEKMRQHMDNLKQVYPHAHVLVIAGNTGHGSDGRVPNAATRSIRAMLGERPASFRIQMFNGKQYNHSSLHENQRIFKLINNFLWQK